MTGFQQFIPVQSGYPGVISLLFFELLPKLLCKLRDNLEQIAYDAVIGDTKDGRLGILVDGDDDPGCFHANQMLDLPGDATGNIQVGAHRPARLTHLVGVGDPSPVHSGT